MDDLLKLVKTYRLTPALDQRLRLGDEIFRHVEGPLRAFVFGSVTLSAAQDVLQEVLRAVALNLRKFAGQTKGEFWSWCYGIARNKISDHFRRRASDRLQPMAEAELRALVESSASSPPLSRGERLDLERAAKLLGSVKPECYNLLWAHYVQGFDYGEIAQERGLTYDAARMQINRCLTEARKLLA